MKDIVSIGFDKISKSKYPKSETEPTNPWAVCHTTVDKDKDPDKYERCVHHVKDKNRSENKKKKADIDTSKPSWSPNVLLPKDEDQFVEDTQDSRLHRKRPPRRSGNADMSHDEFLRLLFKDKVNERDLVPAKSKSKMVVAKNNKCNICS